MLALAFKYTLLKELSIDHILFSIYLCNALICTTPYGEQKIEDTKTNSSHNKTDTADKHRAVSEPYHFLTENSIIENTTHSLLYTEVSCWTLWYTKIEDKQLSPQERGGKVPSWIHGTSSLFVLDKFGLVSLSTVCMSLALDRMKVKVTYNKTYEIEKTALKTI